MGVVDTDTYSEGSSMLALAIGPALRQLFRLVLSRRSILGSCNGVILSVDSRRPHQVSKALWP